MKYGFLHTAAVSPALHVADCAYNTQQIIAAMRAQAVAGTKLLCLPEFTLTGYTCSDLFLQETLCRGAEDGLIQILDASKELDVVALVGLPVRHNGKLYNCAAVVCKGQLLGLVPKTYLPNYGEFYERRHFVPGPKEAFEITFAGQRTLFGTNLLFACREMPEFVLGVEICEDLWAPVPPSCSHALAGATVVANLSASDETVGKAAYRRELVAGQSARLLCGYVYADAGHGESTTDMTFAAHNLIAENGTLLCEAEPFANGTAATELDLGRMVQERIRNTTFVPDAAGYTTISFDLERVRLVVPKQGMVMAIMSLGSRPSTLQARTATSKARQESNPPEIPTTAHLAWVCSIRLARPSAWMRKISSQRSARAASFCGTNGVGETNRVSGVSATSKSKLMVDRKSVV